MTQKIQNIETWKFGIGRCRNTSQLRLTQLLMRVRIEKMGEFWCYIEGLVEIMLNWERPTRRRNQTLTIWLAFTVFLPGLDKINYTTREGLYYLLYFQLLLDENIAARPMRYHSNCVEWKFSYFEISPLSTC